jgi:hypothetical protein
VRRRWWDQVRPLFRISEHSLFRCCIYQEASASLGTCRILIAMVPIAAAESAKIYNFDLKGQFHFPAHCFWHVFSSTAACARAHIRWLQSSFDSTLRHAGGHSAQLRKITTNRRHSSTYLLVRALFVAKNHRNAGISSPRNYNDHAAYYQHQASIAKVLWHASHRNRK